MTVVVTQPDDATLRRARRARVLAAMEEADVDVLIVGREGNARYVSGAPRLWTAGSRPFGPGCVFVRASGAVHLLSTWDEGIPEEIPHENLYGITFNPMNFVTVLSEIEGAATARTGGHRLHVGLVGQPAAQGLPGRRAHRRRAACCARPPGQEPRGDRGHPRVGRVAEEALAAATKALVPGVTERQLTAVFMEAMAAAGVTTPSGQDVAWITSRQDPWRRTNRDTPVQPGDLVAFDAGVVLGGYSGEVGRTHAVREGGHVDAELAQRAGALWERLLDACRSAPRSPACSLRTTPPASPSRPCRSPAASASASTSRWSPARCRGRQASSTRGGHGAGADRLRLEGRRRSALRAGAHRRHGRRSRVPGDGTHPPSKEPDT